MTHDCRVIAARSLPRSRVLRAGSERSRTEEDGKPGIHFSLSSRRFSRAIVVTGKLSRNFSVSAMADETGVDCGGKERC
jgi:hypothetical protein